MPVPAGALTVSEVPPPVTLTEVPAVEPKSTVVGARDEPGAGDRDRGPAAWGPVRSG